jgi:Coenzyme PQQ synthesis protein D (PqqD)
MSTTSWRVSEDVVWAGEEPVRLYHVATGEFRSLNRTGSAIWCLMAGGADNGQIADALTQKMAGGDPAAFPVIAGDVASFLTDLAEQSIVVATPKEEEHG